MDKIRAEFERKIKRPKCVYWNEELKQYDGDLQDYDDESDDYQRMFYAWQLGWKASHDLYTATEAKGE